MMNHYPKSGTLFGVSFLQNYQLSESNSALWDSVLQTLQRGLLRFAYTTLDYAQTGLIASVFLFKVSSFQISSIEVVIHYKGLMITIFA